ncbi:MAG: biotin transport system permease protein [Acetobacteraceae bacterium]|jgi:biotin transport system permease protein|nr:biotin transport system permease protein [Acetobacteraceae bacterium]
MSPLHRLPPALKLLSLLIAGSTLILVTDWRWLAMLCAAVLLLYAIAGIGWRTVWAQFRPVVALLAVLLVVQVLFGDAVLGVAMVLRFAALILLAALVTLTTRTSDMMAALERALHPLVHIGINPAPISLAISLALRFIPVLGERVTQIREAQRARGLDRNFLALAVPLLVHCLRMSDAVAEAIEARSPAPDDQPDHARETPWPPVT